MTDGRLAFYSSALARPQQQQWDVLGTYHWGGPDMNCYVYIEDGDFAKALAILADRLREATGFVRVQLPYLVDTVS